MATHVVSAPDPMTVHSPEPDPEPGRAVGPDEPLVPTGASRARADDATAASGAAVGATSTGPRDDAIPAAPAAERRTVRQKRRQRQIIEWVLLILCALAIALVIKTFLFQAFYIPSESMVPTLKIGDRVLVNKLSYHLHPVHRGDIVVFTAPPGTETAQIKDLVKRVIGLPGDTIEGRADGHIYINGRRLDEPYLPKSTRSKQFAPYRVPAHEYYFLGDNRQFSKDSTVFGPIPRSRIVGRVFVRIWPLSRLGFL